MVAMQISDKQKELIRNTVIITGVPRSGTTLLGNIIGSLAGLEYHFEPPTFYMITSLYAAGQLPLKVASNLLSIYFCEDLLLESVHGRGVNMRPFDDSLILNRISWAELNRRWQQVGNRHDALVWIGREHSRLAVKMPNVMDAVDLFCHAMPSSHLVLVIRDGHDVVRSILRKGWVTDEGLQYDLWPYRKTEQNVPIPYWVPLDMESRWPTMSPESRACLMWSVHAETAKKVVKSGKFPDERLTIVRYEELLRKPVETIGEVALKLGHDQTSYTRRSIEDVRSPASILNGVNTDFYLATDSDILENFIQVNSAWGYSSK